MAKAVAAASPASSNLLRRLLFLFCGVLTGFVLPGLLRIDHSDNVVSIDDEVVQGFAASNAGGNTGGGIDNNNVATRALTMQQQTGKGEVPSSRVSAHMKSEMENARNITQAIVSLSPRIIVLRCEEDSLSSCVYALVETELLSVVPKTKRDSSAHEYALCVCACVRGARLTGISRRMKKLRYSRAKRLHE